MSNPLKPEMSPASTIFLAGHRGLVGSSLHRLLVARGYRNILVRSRRELDLTNQRAVEEFFAAHSPDYVLLAAARVGGIMANSSSPADFIRENLQVQTNVIDAAYRHGAKKLLFLGSSCIYPKHAPQPMREDTLLSGPLEPTNEAYAIAKIAGLKMCQAYRRQYGFDAIALMPTNLYGPGDNFDLDTSHVLPALVRRFHHAVATDAPEVVIWGTGTPHREFLYVDDLADAALFLMKNYSGEQPINVGTGRDIAILELATLIAAEAGYCGAIRTDPSKPNGTPRKLLDVSALTALGWRPRVTLTEGIRRTYEWYSRSTAATDKSTWQHAESA